MRATLFSLFFDRGLVYTYKRSNNEKNVKILVHCANGICKYPEFLKPKFEILRTALKFYGHPRTVLYNIPVEWTHWTTNNPHKSINQLYQIYKAGSPKKHCRLERRNKKLHQELRNTEIVMRTMFGRNTQRRLCGSISFIQTSELVHETIIEVAHISVNRMGKSQLSIENIKSDNVSLAEKLFQLLEFDKRHDMPQV